MADETSTLMPGGDTNFTTPLPKESLEDLKKHETEMFELASHPAWERLRAMFDEHIKALENLQSVFLDTEASAEDFHFRGRVNVEVARVLRGVLAEVDQYVSTK